MSTRNPDSTMPSQRLPAIVLVSPEPDLLAASKEVVRGLAEAPAVKVTDLTGASTIVAEFRPFALVVSDAVFAFDPREFESLAQTVGAEVMVVPAEESRADMTARLAQKLKASLEWWQARRVVAP